MKHILLATTCLVCTAGFAAAEVTLSGSARMGVTSAYDVDHGDNKAQFSSRARVNFSMSGESDGGLAYGASFRADNASDANSGTAGTVFVSGAFGQLSMGDNDSAAQATVGQVDGVGFTGNGDLNEIFYLSGADTSALYTYSSGDLSFALSSGQLGGDTNYTGNEKTTTSAAVAYTMGDYKFSAGIEKGDKAVYSYADQSDAANENDLERNDVTRQIALGADATFGALVVKARLAAGSGEAYNESPNYDAYYDTRARQGALSATYTMDALALTAFVSKSEVSYGGKADSYGVATQSYGVGASYDLGGGAAFKAGYSHSSVDTLDSGYEYDVSRMDAGLTFSF